LDQDLIIRVRSVPTIKINWAGNFEQKSIPDEMLPKTGN